MEYKKMTEQYVAQVAEIERTTFSEPWSEAMLTEVCARPEYVYLLAMEDEEVLGYAGMMVVGDEGQITNVATRSDVRRRGIGRNLVAMLLAMNEERGIRAFTLEVRDGNIPAIALYEGLGFRLAGIRRNYYRKPLEDGRIYWFPDVP